MSGSGEPAKLDQKGGRPIDGAGAIDQRQFRNALGRFASGVTVITTQLGDHVHGMTANAFVSVSLDPPLVLVAVDNRAHMNRILAVDHHYGVSVLAEEQASVSDHFAGRGAGQPAIAFVTLVGVPLVAGALAHLVARVVEAHPAGDHTLYLGQVEHLAWSDKLPLLFFAGSYHQFRPAQPKPGPWPEDEFSLFSLGNFDPSMPEVATRRQP